jgi:hypothetical protein
MRLNVANRSGRPAVVKIWIEGLPGGEIALLPDPLALAPGQSDERLFEIRAARTKGQTDVNRFRIAAQATGARSPEYFDMTFIMPAENRTN